MLGLAVLVAGLAPGRAFAQSAEPQTDEPTADPLPPAAPAPRGYFLLPVPGGQPVYERLGLKAEERGHALVLLSRALHGAAVSNPSGSLAVAFTEIFGPFTQPVPAPGSPTLDEGPEVMLLAPFDDRTWRRLLGLTATADLFTALVKTRGALLVAGGALETGAGVREWLVDHPRLLVDVVRQWPGAFAQAAPGLRRDDEVWDVPGDPAAWTALVGVAPSRGEDFLRRLLGRDEGRLARFYGTLARLPDDLRAALVEPAPGDDAAATLAALYDAAREAEAPWSPNLHPFQLSYADLPSVLHALSDVDRSRLPETASLWPALVTRSIESRQDATALLRESRAVVPFAATVRALLRGGPRERRDRIAMLALARRVWSADQPGSVQVDALYAVGAFRRFRALLLMLDRLEIHEPDVWARLVDAARRIDDGGGQARAERLTLVQGALALVERTGLVGALSPRAAAEVLRGLADALLEPGAAADQGVRAWLVDQFIPALPPLTQPDRFSGTTAYESRVLQALGGPPADAPPHLTWEGLSYTVNPAAAEHARIMEIRAQVPSPGLDAALASTSGAMLAAALRALAYVVALGDPDGAVTLSPDVADRHDLLGLRSAGREFAWRLAAERTGSGAPWHADGSLLGLDLALARSALRRLSADEMPPVPTINLNDELTLARTAVALRPRDFDDDTRARIAASVARGRARVVQAGTDAAAVRRLADETAMPMAVRNALAWTLASTPGAAATLFSLRDLLWLGNPQVPPATLARWGVLGDAVDGRVVTRMDGPMAWDRLAGRPDTGVLATQVPDLALRLAEVTEALHVPAVLIPSLMLYATQDYWHEVEARFADDWPALVRGASSLPSSRVEDYIAALAGAGALRPR